jgi:hypothetical protein
MYCRVTGSYTTSVLILEGFFRYSLLEFGARVFWSSNGYLSFSVSETSVSGGLMICSEGKNRMGNLPNAGDKPQIKRKKRNTKRSFEKYVFILPKSLFL